MPIEPIEDTLPDEELQVEAEEVAAAEVHSGRGEPGDLLRRFFGTPPDSQNQPSFCQCC